MGGDRRERQKKEMPAKIGDSTNLEVEQETRSGGRKGVGWGEHTLVLFWISYPILDLRNRYQIHTIFIQGPFAKSELEADSAVALEARPDGDLVPGRMQKALRGLGHRIGRKPPLAPDTIYSAAQAVTPPRAAAGSHTTVGWICFPAKASSMNG